MIVYILQGSCGEYSDRTDWIVRAYKDKGVADSARTKADREAAQCKKALDEYQAEPKYILSSWSVEQSKRDDIRAEILTVDKEAQFDYTGTTYWVTPCEEV